MPKQMTVVDSVYDKCPHEVREALLELEKIRSNDAGFLWSIDGYDESQENAYQDQYKHYKTINDWLRTFGIKEKETIMIYYWW